MNAEKKIVIDARMLNNSGIGSYIKNVVSPVISDFSNRVVMIKNKSSDTNDLVINSEIYTLKEQVDFFYKLPDCALFWSPHFNIPYFGIKARKRLVTIHDINHLKPWFRSTIREKFKSTIAKFYIARALLISDHIITVSEFTKKELITNFNVNPSKISVVHLGVDFSLFQLGIKADNALLEKYGISKEYIIYLGNIKPHKNLTRLVKAYELSGLIDYHLVIAGEKDKFIERHREFYLLYENLPEKIKSNIIFTGYIEEQDLPKLLSKARLMVFPSFYEGFGLPPLEAMACGCPVIASNAASIPEVCGNAVEYFDPYNISMMSKLMRDVACNDVLRNELISRGIEHVQGFTWKLCSEKHIDIINKLLNEDTNS